MPTYEYRCTSCDRSMEAQQSFTDAPLEKCEFCGGKLRRIFSPVGVLFKGSGFYSTDARSSAKKTEGTSANGEKKPDKAKGDGAPASGESKTGPGKTPSAATKEKAAEKKT